MTGPLAGLPVLDFGQGAAGPYCGQLLGDQGADVIKVEPPRGDWGRKLGSTHAATGMNSTHLAVNRNKRGLCLDLSTPVGRDIARELAIRADVLIESFRPGVMDRLGLGFETLRGENPGLVYCSITGFGPTGPMADRPASDSMMQPFGGLMSVIGQPDGPPLRVGNVVSDMLAATNAFAAVLLALLRRTTTGLGGLAEVSLLDSLVAFQATGLTEFLVTGKVAPPPGNWHPLIGASGITRASDGWLSVGVLDHYWAAFCVLLDLGNLARDLRFQTAEARLAHQSELWARLDPVFATRSVANWVEALTRIGVACGPVNDYQDLIADPQVQHNHLVESAVLADGSQVPMVQGALTLDRARTAPAAPPRLGQHTREILLELGRSPDQIDALVAAGVAWASAAVGPSVGD